MPAADAQNCASTEQLEMGLKRGLKASDVASNLGKFEQDCGQICLKSTGPISN
jgi:hypothetical protein